MTIDCPRAKTWMTPCVARDGRTALGERLPAEPDLITVKGKTRKVSNALVCVGCAQNPIALLSDLGGKYPPALRYRQMYDLENAADVLARCVKEYVEA